ncbi:hypothetical protein AXFE_15680 [Acidithrix ferrooxidans]|uniref:Uncharacterized protein n=1 Tax=Acidithrix ferrooxidans TaxID=1280514 RepID=A0A0D8HKE7_9ACTN|nr:hypothetical protein AXFE_15680 [Acidithrix ferrooxidans]
MTSLHSSSMVRLFNGASHQLSQLRMRPWQNSLWSGMGAYEAGIVRSALLISPRGGLEVRAFGSFP